MPGTQPPDIAPYVVSIGGLQGIITLNGTGILEISTTDNTINFGLAPGAGLGTVTQVSASSSNSNLVVTGGPISTFGTFSFSLAGALNSISSLATSADKMIYTTASDTYAVTPLTALARNLLSDATAANMRITLGSVIGTNVQAYSLVLDAISANSSWIGSDVTFDGSVTVSADLVVAGDTAMAGSITSVVDGTFSGTVTASLFSGSGASLSNLNGSQITSGTVPVTRGGTGLVLYTVGDLIYASSTNVLAKLSAVNGSKYLRSTSTGFAPSWSTLNLPNSATTGDLFIGTSSNTMGNLADVASGNVLLSGGVGVAPAYGKVTSTHTDGTTIATIAAGVNTNIVTFTGTNIAFSDGATFNNDTQFNFAILDGGGNPGNSGDLLTSTGSATAWSNQISLDTLNVVTNVGIEGTITGAGTTGAQVINKPSGTVRFAIGASSLVVTNSGCTTSHRVMATASTNDTTAYVKNVVTANGAFTIVLGAAATAETEVSWIMFQIT